MFIAVEKSQVGKGESEWCGGGICYFKQCDQFASEQRSEGETQVSPGRVSMPREQFVPKL